VIYKYLKKIVGLRGAFRVKLFVWVTDCINH